MTQDELRALSQVKQPAKFLELPRQSVTYSGKQISFLVSYTEDYEPRQPLQIKAGRSLIKEEGEVLTVPLWLLRKQFTGRGYGVEFHIQLVKGTWPIKF